MKKFCLLLVAIFAISIFAACGDSGNSAETTGDKGNETVSETIAETDEQKSNEPKRLSEEEKAKYYKVVEFELPENLRDAMVEHMRKCASVKWVASRDFGMNQVFGNNDWSVSLSYQKGQTYYGLPYTDYFINYNTFESLIVDGKYAPVSEAWQEAPGLNCYSAILLSLQQFDPTEGWTADWVPGQKTFNLATVGPYKAPESPQSTKEINEYNGKDVMYESYRELKKGDIIYKKDFNRKDFLHCRVVVEDATIAVNGAGKVIPSRSYVKCIEQTNSFDKSRKEGVKTTWYVDHIYTFAELYDTEYVPLTLKTYSMDRSELEIPYIALDREITPQLLAKGAFSSTVKSNFPFRYVRIDVLDKLGNVVRSSEKGNLTDTYTVPLRNHFLTFFNGMEKGDYTFVLKAAISIDTVELARVDFKIS